MPIPQEWEGNNLYLNLSRHELVELNPIFDKDNQTANLAIELIMALLGREHGEYQHYLQQQRF